jgi:hypothetical protein
MKFWSTGRIDSKIEIEMFQPVLMEIEDKINSIVEDKNYGDRIVSYDLIVNIFENPSEERFKYSPKTKETDIDVNIDHDGFLNADFNKRCVLFLNAILDSIVGIKSNKHLRNFDFDAFSNDVSSLINRYSLST